MFLIFDLVVLFLDYVFKRCIEKYIIDIFEKLLVIYSLIIMM